MSNGSASSLTVAAPRARRAKIARLVELASAANVSSSLVSSIAVVIARCFAEWLIYSLVKYDKGQQRAQVPPLHMRPFTDGRRRTNCPRGW